MQSGLEFLTFLFASLDQSLTKLRKQSYGFPLKLYYVFVSLFDTVQILILIISKPNVQIKANKYNEFHTKSKPKKNITNYIIQYCIIITI